MSLFPNLAEQYWNENDRHLLQRMEEFWQTSITMNQMSWAESDVDYRFYSGDQTVWNYVYGNIPLGNRRQFNFNRIRRIVEMPSGYQRQHRKSTICVPVENGNQQTADQFTKLLMWNDRNDNLSETISEAFLGSLISGMSLLHLWVDFRNDPVNGEIRVSNSNYSSFLIDPYFRKPDLSDCNGIWKRTYLTPIECMSLLPDRAADIPGFQNTGYRDGKFYYMPENFNYDMKKLLTYDEFYYRTFRKVKLVYDTKNGEKMEWTGKEEELRLFLQTYPELEVIDNMIPSVNCAIVVQGKVLYHDRNPTGLDSYNFVPVVSYYSPDLPYFEWRVQGMVRNLRDAQYLYNRRKVIELDIMESQINSGWIAKEGSTIDPKSLYKAGQGQVVWTDKNANIATDLVQIQAPAIPPQMMAMSETLSKEIEEISGVNSELLGAAQDDKAGILSMLRQGAGLTTLQRLFDQLDLSQKLLGKMILKTMQLNFTPGKVKRILNEEPTAEFYNKNFLTYDCAVEEGLDTTTQKQLQFAQMLQMRELGVQIPDESLLEAATIQNKDKIIELIKQREQQGQQQQQMQAQMAQQDQEAKINLASAQAEAERGLGMERMSKISENQAKAQADQEASLLNMAKVLKELDSIDLSHIEKLINMTQTLKDQQSAEIEQVRLQQSHQLELLQQMMAMQQQAAMAQQPQENQGQVGQPGMAQPPMQGQ